MNMTLIELVMRLIELEIKFGNGTITIAESMDRADLRRAARAACGKKETKEMLMKLESYAFRFARSLV